MSHVTHQVHDKFKSFVGTSVDAIGKEVAAFIAGHNVAAKSIGIVHVGKANQLLFSLGYRDDEPGYKVTLSIVSLGHIDAVHSSGVNALDAALTKAVGSHPGVICHELFADSSGNFSVVFMNHAG